MRQAITITVLFVLAIGCSHPATAEAGDGMPHGKGMHHPGMMGGHGMMGPGMHNPTMGMVHGIMQKADELGLTDEQVGKLHRMVWTMKKEMGENPAHEARQALHLALRNPAASKEDVRKASKAYSEAHEKHVEAMVEAREKVMGVLTEEQREKLEGMKDEFIHPHRNGGHEGMKGMKGEKRGI